MTNERAGGAIINPSMAREVKTSDNSTSGKEGETSPQSRHAAGHNVQFSWSAPEHVYTEKGPDWFWAVGIITLTLAIAAIAYGNVLFAIVIVVGAVALTLQSLRRPQTVEFAIGERGITADETLYPYSTLHSFWVEHNPHEQKLILQSQKTLMPYIVIPIDKSEVDPEAVRHELLYFLPEEEHLEPLSQKIMEYLGF